MAILILEQISLKKEVEMDICEKYNAPCLFAKSDRGQLKCLTTLTYCEKIRKVKKIVFANKEEFADVINKPEKSFPKVLASLEKTTK